MSPWAQSRGSTSILRGPHDHHARIYKLDHSSDHSTFDRLVDELRDGVTTFSMDRRGFGASGDAAGYSIQREFEDVAAVVQAVAAHTGGPVALWATPTGPAAPWAAPS